MFDRSFELNRNYFHRDSTDSVTVAGTGEGTYSDSKNTGNDGNKAHGAYHSAGSDAKPFQGNISCNEKSSGRSRESRKSRFREIIGIILLYLFSRFVLYSIAFLGNLHYSSDVNVIDGDMSIASIINDTKEIICEFDCKWFIDVAKNGYDPAPTGLSNANAANWAFLPGYPMLAKVVSLITGFDTLTSLLLVSNLFFLLALFLWNSYIKLLKINSGLRRLSLIVLCFLPYSIYYLAPYTESMFLAFTLAAFIAMKKKHFLLAGILGMGMTVTRNVGVMFVFPLLLAGIMEYGFRNIFRLTYDNAKLALGIMLVPLPMFIFQNYLYHITGDSFAFMHIQLAWGRSMDNPINHIINGIAFGGYKLYFSLMIIASLPLIVFLARCRMYVETLFFIICAVIPLCTGVNAYPRYIFGLMPCILALTLLMKKYTLIRQLLPVICGMFSIYFVIAWGHSKFFVV